MARLNVEGAQGVVDSFGLPCQQPAALVVEAGQAQVRRFDGESASPWPVVAPADGGHVLVSRPGSATVRGVALLLGCCQLLDGDVIECENVPFRYAERDFLDPERTEPFNHPAPGEQEVLCAICMDVLEPGAASVYCPKCGWAFHGECASDEQLSSCPICSCAVCSSDDERLAFILQR